MLACGFLLDVGSRFVFGYGSCGRQKFRRISTFVFIIYGCQSRCSTRGIERGRGGIDANETCMLEKCERNDTVGTVSIAFLTHRCSRIKVQEAVTR